MRSDSIRSRAVVLSVFTGLMWVIRAIDVVVNY
jgi:hypothetical protein